MMPGSGDLLRDGDRLKLVFSPPPNPCLFPFEKCFTNSTLRRFTLTKYLLSYYLHNICLM